MNPFVRVIAALNRSGVRYVIVGGFAAYLHGTKRLTIDLDIVVDLTESEARKAIEALLAEGFASRLPVDARLFADAAERARWVREKGLVVFSLIAPGAGGFVVDLFAESPLDFEALYARSAAVELEGQRAQVCCIADLIDMKLRAGRPQDLADVAALRDIESVRRDASGSGP